MSDTLPTPARSQSAPIARVPYVRCPICESTDFRLHREADCMRHKLWRSGLPPTMRWMRCAVCTHVFTDGYFAPAALKLLFSGIQDSQQVGHDMEQQRTVSARMIQRVTPYISEGDWLDVGFGNGSLLFTAAEFGFTSVGLDLRERNVAALRRIGFEAHCVPLETLEAPGRFSVISLADVLEHMPFPRIGLAAAARLLRPNGAVLISMPNLEAPLWPALDAAKQNPYWGELEHYHNFGRRLLYTVLQQHGLRPVAYGISERYRACMEVIAIRDTAIANGR